MSTFKSIMGIENDRTNPGAASRRIVAAGLAVAAVLAVATGAPRPAYADATPTPPVSKCSSAPTSAANNRLAPARTDALLKR